MTSRQERLEELMLAPMRRTGRNFYIWVGFLLVIIAVGGVAYSYQAREGLWATGMRDRIMWGLYVALFVVFIGASMAGTFVSAILRLSNAEWRGPIVRGAEIMTVAALVTAGLFIMVDMGRPDRAYHIVLYGRWESPLIWDVYGLTTYLAGSMIYLYLAMIPDLALVRDRIGSSVSAPMRTLYRLFAVGWTGDPGQVRHLLAALTMMTIIMIPVAVMMHTVTSWIFGMTLRDPWNNPMFGIFFVAGAIYSGVGLIAILMVIMRKVYHLEEFITERHFLNLGYLLAAGAVIMIFFNVSEFVTLGYKLSAGASFNLHQMVDGALAPVFWIYIWGGLLLPIVVILIPRTRTITGIVLASVAANIGMFLERYFIVVGGLRVPLNPYEPADYIPTWVEWSLMAAGISVFALLVTLMLKFLPGIAVWEIREREEQKAEVAAQEPQKPELPEPGLQGTEA